MRNRMRSCAVVAGSALLLCAGLAVMSSRAVVPARHEIHLNGASFDPLADTASARTDGTGEASFAGTRYFLVQMTSRITTASRNQLEAAGIRVLHYVPDDTYIVASSAEAIARARQLPAVRWAGVMLGADKLSPGLDARFDAEINGRIEQARSAGVESARGIPLVDSRASITIQVLPMEAAAADAVAEVVRLLGGNVLALSKTGLGAILARVPRESLTKLADDRAVLWIERDLPVFPGNDTARWTIQSDDSVNFTTPIHAHGIHGEGQIVTIADLGIDAAHPMFDDPGVPIGDAHRKIRAYYSLCTDPQCEGLGDDECINHGTHVAGVVAGDAAPIGSYEPIVAGTTGEEGPHDGQAFGARIEVQDVKGNCGSCIPANYADLFAPAIDPGRFPVGTSVENFSWIHTNSWSEGTLGAGDPPGSYRAHAAQMDGFIHDHPWFTAIFIADNFGPALGTAAMPSVAKNVIGVGASYNGVSANDVWDGSGRGPALDGRLKPDLLAPGVGIWSAKGCQGKASNPICEGQYGECISGTYVQAGGTSNAAPVVAGAAALVRQYYMNGWYPRGVAGSGPALVPSGALVKATLINSAVEVTGGGAYGTPNTSNYEPFYPNDHQGWGRILLDDALYFQGDARNLVVHDEATGLMTGGSTTYSFYNSSSAVPLKATLVWSDAPGIPDSSTNLVNDLDLVVTAPDGTTTYHGNKFADSPPPHQSLAYAPDLQPPDTDTKNNVEGVLVLAPTTGTWTVTVKGTNVPMGPQIYALVITGANDQDGDGDPDTSDCAPTNPAIHHGAAELCNGIDDNCSGAIDEGFPDCDGDGLANCVDPDDDNDGEPDTTDCAPCDPTANHNTIEAIPFYGGAAAACQDGVDNDCDGVVDLDCAVDVDPAGQAVGPGVIISGTLSDLRATSTQSPTSYEVINESGSGTKKLLTAVWTFTTSNFSGWNYDLAVEAFHNATSNADNYDFSYYKKTAGQCLVTDTGWGSPVLTVSGTSDSNAVQRAFIGTLSPSVVCVRAQDTRTSSDSQVDTLTMDRVYLMPTATCPDADGDGYASSCSNCNNSHCPTLDCDDADAQRNPGVTEGPPGYPTCSDGKDNDCDGLVDMADTQSCVPPPPSVLASADAGIGPGQIITPDFTLTQETDDTWEVSKETTAQNRSKLTQTWRFDNVPNGSNHSLRLEAHRNNGADDTFQFSWSTDGTHFTDIPGALINHPFENIGGQLYPFGAGGQSGTFYIQAKSSGSGTALDSLYVDFMVIMTDP